MQLQLGEEKQAASVLRRALEPVIKPFVLPRSEALERERLARTLPTQLA